MGINYVILEATINDASRLNLLMAKLIMYERKFSNNIASEIQVTGNYLEIINDEKSIIYVAKYNNNVIGFIYAYEKTLDEIFINKEAFVEAIFIESEYQNQGIGYNLITEVIKWAKKRNIKYIDIEVMKKNESAINAYTNWGFKENKIGMRKEII